MKIYAIFRGFPGLGRVVSGLSLLEKLRDKGHKVKAYAYLQGEKLLKAHNIEKIIDDRPINHQIMAIGLNPISKESSCLIQKIIDDKPDLVIVDGETLLVSTLSYVYSPEKLLILLNPTDISNPSLPLSTIKFYRTHYLSAKNIIVHNFTQDDYSDIAQEYGVTIKSLSTIIREEIFKVKNQRKAKKIVGILGGGSANSTEDFFKSTVKMVMQLLNLARFTPEEEFVVYCNDKNIHREIIKEKFPQNFRIESDFKQPCEIYSEAKAIIFRAGRNTTSEVLYLEIPGLLFSVNGDFRSAEQNKNIENACKISNGMLDKIGLDEDIESIKSKLIKVIENSKEGNNNLDFKPGNDEAIKFIEEIMVRNESGQHV